MSVQKWSCHYPFSNTNVWPRLFKLPFKTVRDTKIQTFQYRIIQKMIPCNKRLHNIKIKNSPDCDYCNNKDDLPHYFIRCQKVAEFWTHYFNWWVNLIRDRHSQVVEGCIWFGLPSNSAIMLVHNFCILFAKYYIYIQRLFNNNTLDLYACPTQLKQALKIEEKYV